LGSDLPYIAKEAFLPFYHKDLTSVFDLGGDNVGARILRQFCELVNYQESDLLLCVNIFRENTASVDKILKMITDIEDSSGMKITGLINNSNYLRETKIENLLEGEFVLKEVANLKGLQIVYTGVYEKLLNGNLELSGEVIPLKLYLRKAWL
ncbi:MAG: ATP-binding protein, partial [Bacilli bacterium]|nr:ATP-binding protein [Bacilli bacterium]